VLRLASWSVSAFEPIRIAEIGQEGHGAREFLRDGRIDFRSGWPCYDKLLI
jgi:hypothetical protein